MTTTSETTRTEPRPSTDEGSGARGHPAFEWVGGHARPVSIILVIVSVVLGVAGFQIRAADENPEEPAFDPGGEIYDIQDRERELFDAAPAVLTARFFVEAPDPVAGDVLTRSSLAEFLANAELLLDDPEARGHLTSRFDNELGVQIDGVYSVAHAVDDHLPGGLAAATDADVKRALAEILADDGQRSGLRATLSQLTTSDVGDVGGQRIAVWESPAFLADVVYEPPSFAIDDPDSTLVMSRSPMPIFADFGLLTAVMILFSLIVSLLILPSLLLLVTPSRKGEERQQLLAALRTEDYEPHGRRTAVETAHR